MVAKKLFVQKRHPSLDNSNSNYRNSQNNHRNNSNDNNFATILKPILTGLVSRYNTFNLNILEWH